MLDYAALKTEIGLPAYAGKTDAEVATLVNAQTVALPPQDVPVADVRSVLFASPTGDWAKLTLLSRSTAAAGDTAGANAVAQAITAHDTLSLATTLHTSKAPDWTAVQAMLAGLGPSGANVISQASIDALTAMRTPSVPRWQPPVTAADVAHARSV